jgi:hypothetical protein
MREPRNPFRLRRSESIDTDAAFLTLFEPGILEVLSQDSLWESVRILRSAAGGGKTSLIRLFTPTVLLSLAARKGEERIRELHQRMKELEAIDDNGPRVLGVMLTCGPGYSMLQDLDVEQSRKDRMFFGLLNARIILAVLRGVIALKGLNFPDALSRVIVSPPAKPPSLQHMALPCNGQDLHAWAEQREATLCESLDSLGPLRADTLPGDDALHSLELIQPTSLTVDGMPVGERVLLMMDDVQKLTSHQRGLLVQTVIDARSPVGVWIAERFEALSAQEMLSSGATQGRDYGATIEIESYWRARPEKFERLAMKVADRRVDAASDTEIDSFRSCLQESMAGPEWDARSEQIVGEVADRVRTRFGAKERFQEWIRIREEVTGSAYDRAIEWRALEILIERELAKKQKGLFDDEPLDEGDLAHREDSSLNNAAELFLAKEFKLPYYFGPERVARLASLNIQQFLGLGGEVFEEATAAELLRKITALPAERQHALMKGMAKQLWEEIPRKVRHGRELRQFIESVGRFAHWYTYRPTAPNDPGVTGTAIRMSERAQLLAEAISGKRKEMVRLADTLTSALAHNLLVTQLDYNCKKEKWMLLNLNRLLCVHFDLPLGYGLYKEKPLQTLCQWLDKPFAEPKATGELL